MKSFTFASILALVAAVSAQNTVPTQSAPFALKIKSSNATLNGLYLYSCHAGAAEEGLCPGSGPGDAYYLNASAAVPSSGSLVWNLPVGMSGGVVNVSSTVNMVYHPSSNLAVPLFQPGGYAVSDWGFDADQKLFISDWYDETKAVALHQPQPASNHYYNWVICWTWVGGYWYQGLAWVTYGAPANPTCQSVDVIREFV
jgi:hypothetical protein